MATGSGPFGPSRFYCFATNRKKILFVFKRFFVYFLMRHKLEKLLNTINLGMINFDDNLPLRFRKAGMFWCGGARETY